MLSHDHTQARADAMTHPALVDAETGLANRLHFELVYNYLFEAGDRGMAFTVMIVKTQASTPEAIRDAARVLRRVTRAADLVSHVAEGRFVLLLLGTNAQGARIVADRIELALEAGVPGPLAFGLASYSPDIDASVDLLVAAEQALEAAATAGGGVEVG
jgi:GGDEF domain-containing protein